MRSHAETVKATIKELIRNRDIITKSLRYKKCDSWCGDVCILCG